MAKKDDDKFNGDDDEYIEDPYLPDDEEDSDIITLLDEDNNELNFKLLDVTEYEGKKYVLLIPAEEIEGYEENDVVIMELHEKESMMEAVVDDDYAQKIFDFYNEEMDEEELFDVDDDDGNNDDK